MKKAVAAGLSRHRVLNPNDIWRAKPAATPRQSPISSACEGTEYLLDDIAKPLAGTTKAN
jgi:hypothetical protein